MQRLARTIARLLELSPDLEVALDLENADLSTSLASLMNASGAQVIADATVQTSAGVIELAKAPSPLVSERAMALVSRVLPGGTVVVAIHGVTENAQAMAFKLGPSFDIQHVHAELETSPTDGAALPTLVMRGVRRPQPKRDQIKELRGIAHSMEASILIGRDGLSEGLITSAREALARHGLIKAKLTPRARLDKQDSAVALAWAIGGQLIQRVGKTAVIFRPDVELAPPGVKH